MAKYTDTDELLKRLNACKYFVEKPTRRQAAYNTAISNVCRTVNVMPDANVVEVRHGKWIDPEDTTCYKCSICGEYATQEYGLTEPIFWRYCPNCGAKMDLEKNNG